MTDHYKTLGVRRNADQQEIKDQYRTLSKKYHPDKSMDGDTERFKAIASAYEILSDPEKRKMYDLTGSDISDADFDRKAGGLLQQLFQLIVTQNGLVAIQKLDVIGAVNAQLDTGMKELDKNIDVARKSRKEIGKVVKRLKHKNKMNPVRLMLIQEIQKHTDTITTSNEGKEVGKRARRLWKEYGFDYDQEQMKVNYRIGYGMGVMNNQTVTLSGIS
jgi:curved DNA-binding protein CbpA